MSRCCLQRALALRGLGRAADAAEQVEKGLVAAREDGMAFEEALLLLERARANEGAGGDAAASADRADADAILTRLGARA